MYRARVQYMSWEKGDDNLKTEIKYFLFGDKAIKWVRNYSRKNNCCAVGQVSKNSKLLYTLL